MLAPARTYPAVARALHVDEVTTLAGFEALKPEWDKLLAACARPEIYQTHEWMSAWWACMGRGRSLLILTVRSGGELVGLAPLMRRTERMFGIPVRKVEFITMMRHADAPTNCSASLDFLLLPARRDEALAAIVEHLGRCRWDCLRLHPIPAASGTAGLVEGAALARGWHAHVRHVFDNAVVPVVPGWEAYMKALSPRFAKSLRAQERRLANKGEVKFVEFPRDTDVGRLYQEILDVEERSWKWNVGVSLNSVAFNDFYRVFAEKTLKNGWVRLWMMQVNGRNVAYDYIVDYHGQVASLKTSYDDAFRNCGPGNLLTWHEFQRFFEDGTREISLLWGDMSNKERWMTRLEPHVELTVWRDGFRGSLLDAAEQRTPFMHHRRTAIELKNRLARKLGIRLHSSELTRADQLAPAAARKSGARKK